MCVGFHVCFCFALIQKTGGALIFVLTLFVFGGFALIQKTGGALIVVAEWSRISMLCLDSENGRGLNSVSALCCVSIALP